jgi:putative hemolysin
MKRSIRTMAVLIIGVLAIAACGGKAEPTANMPNPASVYCEENGGKVDIRTAADGSQQGFCVFADGTECDEWAYYRSECAPGTPKP